MNKLIDWNTKNYTSIDLLALGKFRENNDRKDEDSNRNMSKRCDGRSRERRGIKQVGKQSSNYFG